MKSFAFVIIFACAAVNFIRMDAMNVQIAQAQQDQAPVMVATR